MDCIKERNHERIKSVQACEEVREKPIISFKKDQISFFTCPGNFKDPSYSYILNLCDAYEKGINPFGGAIADVPNKLQEIWQVIASFRYQTMKQNSNQKKTTGKRPPKMRPGRRYGK